MQESMAPSLEEVIRQIRTANLSPFETDLDTHVRVIRDKYPNGLGFSKKASSRFSDPDKVNPSYGVIYAAQDLATCVAEVIVRDTKVGNSGKMVLSYKKAVSDWRAISITSKAPLRLLNLTGLGLIQFGIKTNIVRQKGQKSSRQLGKAIHDNPAGFDGILYGSRITMGQCIAIFDRAIPKLKIDQEIKLTDMEADLADIYRSMNIVVRRT